MDIKKFISRKLLGAIIATAVIVFGLPITPDMQAQIVAVLWSVYMASQGAVDVAEKVAKK